MRVLEGKIVFLTGGGAGIGYSCAKAYVKAGAKVFVLDRDQPSLSKLEAELGSEAIFTYMGNVQNGDDIKEAITAALEMYQRLDVIHNNAGMVGPSKPLDQTTEEEWESLFSTNLKSVYWTTRFGLEALKKTKGCILNTSSMVAQLGQENHAAYVASKGGMNALTKAMALDYAPYGIRVNAVCPAAVQTPMLRQWASEQPNPKEIESYLDNIHALGYCPNGDVVADVAVFLVSDAARFVTGCVMPVSGGAELGYKK